jgi:glucokinase
MCKTSNLPWVIDAEQLSKTIRVPSVTLINDLVSTAYGVNLVPNDEIVSLASGSPDAYGNRAVIAAGTGLGEAGLLSEEGRLRPFASEGGHADFAPRNETQVALLQYLRKKYRHVSWERVLSGPGLVNIYSFLGVHQEGRRNRAVFEQVQRDGASAISDAAMSDRCPVCRDALSLFVEMYGAEAGNLALKVMATGGVYVGGGIAGRILTELTKPEFLEAFCDKGRMRPVMESIPIRVLTTNRAALLGAAEYARLEAGNWTDAEATLRQIRIV